VTHLGRALYQLAHADGWNSLDQQDGLLPTGGSVTIISQENLLGPEPDQWPANLFDHDPGELLYEQRGVFPD
jgi:hypothetical protein